MTASDRRAAGSTSSVNAQLGGQPLPRSAIGRVPTPALVLVSIASVQTGSGVARNLFDELGALGTTLLRLGLSAVLMMVILRPAVGRWSGRSWQSAILLGVAVAGMNMAFYLSLRTVPLGIAVTVEFIGPLLLALVQTRRLVDLFWAVLAGGGVALLGFEPAPSVTLSGLALALVAGLCWAGYILANARLGQVLPGGEGLAVALVVATLLVLPVGISGASGVITEPALLLPATAVALLSSIVPYGLEFHTLRRLSTRVFGILLSLEPAAAAASGFVLLGQHLGTRELVAMVMVSLASAGVTLGRRTGQLPSQPLE